MITEPAAPNPYVVFSDALKADPERAWSWHCNIAMPIMDYLKVSPADANLAAVKLMKHLFDVDTEALARERSALRYA